MSTIKGYATAISSRHAPIDGHPVSTHPSVSLWMKGLRNRKGLPRVLIPPWNLELVLQALKKWPFEPVNVASRKHLTWKAVFLVAITSARRASELHALRHVQPYISFSAENVTLFPDVAFLPKVNTPFHASRPLCLPSLSRELSDLRLLCVRRILKVYLNRTAAYRAPDAVQLFVTYGGKSPGSPVSKQRISAWLVELIEFVYKQADLPIPQGIKGHQTRSQAASLADLAGVSPQQICDAATWATGCTFARHYRLDMTAQVRSQFGRSVLTISGSAPADPDPLRGSQGSFPPPRI